MSIILPGFREATKKLQEIHKNRQSTPNIFATFTSAQTAPARSEGALLAQRILKPLRHLRWPSSPSRGRQPNLTCPFQSEEGHGRKTVAEGFCKSGERSSTLLLGAAVYNNVHVKGALLRSGF
jgi:hypothetical protein